jgi:hypothetical protein
MKTIAAIAFLFSIANASTCVESVQAQLDERYNSGYFLEIRDEEPRTLGTTRLISDFMFVADEAATQNPETPVYRAESSAAGCYGYEFVLFDQESCQVLAVGGGYCD